MPKENAITVRAVSADSHVLEPPDLWVQRVDAAYRHRAPRVERGPEGNVLIVEGREPQAIRPLGTPFAMWGKQTEEGRRGGWDPAARLEDMAIDGIEAEVLYPSMALITFGMEDGNLQAACFRAYNDWLAEFCRAAPSKLYGIGLIPMHDVQVAIDELRRCVQLGLPGAAIWGTPPQGHPFASSRNDPFFAEAQALGVPLSLHCFTGKPEAWQSNFMASYTMSTQRIQESLAVLLFSGVFERFPSLKFISVENDIGWVPYLLQRMDYGYQRKGKRRGLLFESGMLPSDQFRRSVRCTFMTDPAGIALYDLVGPDTLLWATDYPHDDSTWPNSRQVLDAQFKGLTSADREKVVFSNAVTLYNMRV